MKLFLDTSFFYFILTEGNTEAKEIFTGKTAKISNEYAMKELKRTLSHHGHNSHGVEDFIKDIRLKVIILPMPSKERKNTVEISDKSDWPILVGAKENDAVLVTFDHKLAREARKYVKTILLE